MAYDIATVNNIPEIISKVDIITADVKQRIAALQLDTIEATEDNKKLLKDTRAALKKETEKFEEDIKLISNEINRGLDVLKEQYKTKIKTLYVEQDNLLKEKIEKITLLQKKENDDYAREYYENKLKSMPLRIGVRYEDIPWDYSFNSSKKSIRETVDKHFESVSNALMVIETHEYKLQLEVLWIKHKFDLGKALIELQQDLAKAESLMRQKELARENEIKAKAELEARQKEQALRFEQDREAEKQRLATKAVEPIISAEEIINYVISLELTDSELLKVVNFFEENNIEYKIIE